MIPLFLFFCLFTQSASAWSVNPYVHINDTDEYTLSERGHSISLFVNRYSDFSHSPFQWPAEPTPKPNKPNENENIKDNKNDVEWSGFRLSIDGNFGFVLKFSRVSLAQFEQNALKRTKISLVVLYHSWKSFLS